MTYRKFIQTEINMQADVNDPTTATQLRTGTMYKNKYIQVNEGLGGGFRHATIGGEEVTCQEFEEFIGFKR